LELYGNKTDRPETHLIGTGLLLISGVEQGEKAVAPIKLFIGHSLLLDVNLHLHIVTKPTVLPPPIKCLCVLLHPAARTWRNS
jgi:hypothetical protein